MLIGVDFDNTLVSYDPLFHRVALERELIPPNLARNKTAVRDHLRATGRESVWTELQGEVYGARLAEATPFPGAREFFADCRRRGVQVVIISHKTRHPFLGPKYDLHAAAHAWLVANAFLTPGDAHSVWFELTKAEKLARIATAGCTVFIDDLPEILSDPGFPSGVQRWLFDPQRPSAPGAGIHVINHWSTALDLVQTSADCGAAVERLLRPFALRAGPLPAPVSGGANNRVYRIDTAPGGAVLLKRYFSHPDDARNRFASEHAFYRYAEATGLGQIPKSLGWDAALMLGLFQFVEGVKPAEAAPALIDAALRFVSALNRPRDAEAARQLPPASEACFSLEAHLRAVADRVAHLGKALNPDDEPEAYHLLVEGLLPAWEAVERDVRQQSHSSLAEPLPETDRCVSPSDFGFHNSLITPDGRVVFLDFEYAGWDDPAKLVCDFFCQPDVRVPITAFPAFAQGVAEAIGGTHPDAFMARCRRLLPVYRIKWSCILLNEFTRVGRERRAFSLGAAAAAARRQRQLERARTLLAELPVPV